MFLGWTWNVLGFPRRMDFVSGEPLLTLFRSTGRFHRPLLATVYIEGS